MLNTVILQRNETEIYFIKFILEQLDSATNFTIGTSIKEHGADATQFFANLSNNDIIILSYSIPGADEIIEMHIANKLKKPMIITLSNKEEQDRFKIRYKYNALIGSYDLNSSPEDFLEEYRKLMKFHARMSSQNTGYSPILIDYLLDLRTTSVDLFIKLGEDKFVKIIRRLQSYDRADIEKYLDKNIKHLYIKQRDIRSFALDVGERLKSKYLEELEDVILLLCL